MIHIGSVSPWSFVWGWDSATWKHCDTFLSNSWDPKAKSSSENLTRTNCQALLPHPPTHSSQTHSPLPFPKYPYRHLLCLKPEDRFHSKTFTMCFFIRHHTPLFSHHHFGPNDDHPERQFTCERAIHCIYKFLRPRMMLGLFVPAHKSIFFIFAPRRLLL